MNRMRGMLEDEMTQKRNEKLKQMQDENKRLALEKKQREHKWKVEQENLNQKEITNPNFNWIQPLRCVTWTKIVRKLQAWYEVWASVSVCFAVRWWYI